MKIRVFKIAVVAAAVMTAVAAMAESGPKVDRDEALARLRDGNARFVAGEPQAWNGGQQRRQELADGGQQPIACIITCSDSRVSPEILFDQSLGDLFVVRLAGNVVTAEATASVEYAVGHLHVPIVVVLGHTNCGAVQAAMESGESVNGPMATLLGQIRKSLEAARAKGFAEAELYTAAVNENVRRGSEELVNGSRAIDEAVRRGEATLLCAVYDLHSGVVQWQMQFAAAAAPVKAVPASTAAAATPEKSTATQAAAKPRARKTPDESATYARRYR